MKPAPALFRILPIALLTAACSGHALTLHEAQEVLFKNNPDLAVMRLEVERAQDQLQEAQASWLPSVDALANYSYATEVSRLQLTLPVGGGGGLPIDRTLGDHDKIEFGLDASYPLFTGFTRGRNVQSKSEGVAAKEAQWRGAKNQVSLKLAALYYAWQLAQVQTAYQQKVLEHSQALQKQLEDFVRAGTGVRSRALGAEAKAKAAEVDLLAARNASDSLQYELLDFLGSRDSLGMSGASEAVPDSIPLPRPDWEMSEAPAGSQRAEAEALDHAAAQARLGGNALAGQRLPQLYGMAGYRYANPGLNLAGDSFMNYGLVGLQLKWNLFDGARNRSQRKQLEVQTRELLEQKRKLEGEWWKSQRLAQVQYARWDAQYHAAQASRDAAEASATDLQRQFQAGVATGLDWLEARNQSARAEMLMAQARTMQRLSLLQWRYAAGKDLRF